MSILVTLIALLLEAFFGYPDRLLRAIGHPVTWIGRLIDDLDRLLNREAAADATRRRAGALTLLILVSTVGTLAYLFEYNLTALPFGYLGVALVASTLIAQRSSMTMSLSSRPPSSATALRADATRYRTSSDATHDRSTKPASHGQRSRVWRRTFPTES